MMKELYGPLPPNYATFCHFMVWLWDGSDQRADLARCASCRNRPSLYNAGERRIRGVDIGYPQQDLLFEVCRINGIWAYRIRPYNLNRGHLLSETLKYSRNRSSDRTLSRRPKMSTHRRTTRAPQSKYRGASPQHLPAYRPAGTA
jgi:hypothetical protein